MSKADAFVDEIEQLKSWDARVAKIRLVPEQFGTADHAQIYSAIAQRVYVPQLDADFAYIHWKSDYELANLEPAYDATVQLTASFSNVDVLSLEEALFQQPRTLRVFRLLLGLTGQEFAESTAKIAASLGFDAVGKSRVQSMEEGKATTRPIAQICARVVDLGMRDELFPRPGKDLRSKIQKPDTAKGWETVREFAANGVPLVVLLHQRQYGGAFNQLLNATSTKRGNSLEEAVESLLKDEKILFIRTGAHDQEEIAKKFGISVKPAPDFVVYDKQNNLRAVLECKAANDGGTARDKASRFASLRTEATRLNGIPLFAVLGGLGWTRTKDALGPVVRDTQGRVFTASTLSQMLSVQPFSELAASR